MNRKLYRSTSNKMLGGVCAGLAEYLDLDPTLVRLFFVILMLASDVGVWIYLILWIVLPRADHPEETSVSMNADEIANRARQMGSEMGEAFRKPNKNAGMFVGIGLVVVGFFLFVDQLNIQWLQWFRSDMLWAILLVVGGAALLVRAFRKE
jgi:phage shock protein C